MKNLLIKNGLILDFPLCFQLSSCRNIVKENSSRDGMVGGGHRGHASSLLHNGGQLGAVTSTSANNLSSLGTTTAQNTGMLF